MYIWTTGSTSPRQVFALAFKSASMLCIPSFYKRKGVHCQKTIAAYCLAYIGSTMHWQKMFNLITFLDSHNCKACLFLALYASFTSQIGLEPPKHMSCLQEHDEKFVDDIVWGEDLVQLEDVALCDLVQEGIFSPVYDVGRQALVACCPAHLHIITRQHTCFQKCDQQIAATSQEHQTVQHSDIAEH